MAILKDIDEEIGAFKIRADSQSSELQNRIKSFIESSVAVVSAYQYKANYRSGIDAARDFQDAISPEVMKLQATITWGKFLAQTSMNTLILRSDMEYFAGYVGSGRQKLKVVDQQIGAFLAQLPKDMSNLVRENDLFKKIKVDLKKRSELFDALIGVEIDSRQKETLTYQLEKFKNSQKLCANKYPNFSNKMIQIQSEIDQFLAIQSKHKLEVETQRFLGESLGARLGILLDLCKEFLK
ncbi:MAG TPA: hypothetical protein PLT55_05100 [Acidimicrobiia bacterium]|nr:hypothetical protein [Acidimicrobiia bacterium]